MIDAARRSEARDDTMHPGDVARRLARIYATILAWTADEAEEGGRSPSAVSGPHVDAHSSVGSQTTKKASVLLPGETEATNWDESHSDANFSGEKLT